MRYNQAIFFSVLSASSRRKIFPPNYHHIKVHRAILYAETKASCMGKWLIRHKWDLIRLILNGQFILSCLYAVVKAQV